jgi:hypothetical protein
MVPPLWILRRAGRATGCGRRKNANQKRDTDGQTCGETKPVEVLSKAGGGQHVLRRARHESRSYPSQSHEKKEIACRYKFALFHGTDI